MCVAQCDTEEGVSVLQAHFTIRDSRSPGPRNSAAYYMSSDSFTPTSEQIALRDARRLKRQQAKAEARAASSTAPPAPLVNLSKGQITPRSWLTVQDGHQTASRPVRIMTWNVRDWFIIRCVCPNRDTLMPQCFQLLAQCLVREWRSVMAIIEREL